MLSIFDSVLLFAVFALEKLMNVKEELSEISSIARLNFILLLIELVNLHCPKEIFVQQARIR